MRQGTDQNSKLFHTERMWPFVASPSKSSAALTKRFVLCGDRTLDACSVNQKLLPRSTFLGDLRWVARFEPNQCEPNQSTYRQRLPKVCQQQFHGQDEN